MTDYEFLAKYMGEIQFGKPESFWGGKTPQRIYPISKDELPKDLTQETYKQAMAHIHNKTSTIDDVLTFGQYIAWSGLSLKYGAGWWKRTPWQKIDDLKYLYSTGKYAPISRSDTYLETSRQETC